MKAKLMTDSDGDNTTEPQLLSRAEVAALLGVCRRTVQRMEWAGRLKSVRFNRRLLRYHRAEIEKLITDAALRTAASER